MIVFDVTDLIIFIIGGLAVFFLLVEWVITRIKTAIRKINQDMKGGKR